MNIEVGYQLPAIKLLVDRQTVVRYAGASTDFNPIHYSDFHAKALGLDGCIAHGMWTMGAALRIVTDWIGDPSLVKSYFTRFTAPVPVLDNGKATEVEVQAKVTAVDDNLATIAIEAYLVPDTDSGDAAEQTETASKVKVLGAARAEVEIPTDFEDEPASCELEHRDFNSATPDNLADVDFVEPSKKLADHTTFRVGGQAQNIVVANTERELIEAVKYCDDNRIPLLVLSGGSNTLVSDDGFPGTVVKVNTKGINADVSSCGGAVVRVQAGEVWDDLVQLAISQEWIGLEALSGIPGLVGAAPIQNIGAYGADISQTVTQVRTYDRQTGQYATFALADCGFGYRTSRFKQTRFGDSPTGRYVVLEVTFQFLLGSLSNPVQYQELADRLGVQVGQRVPMSQVRQQVLAARKSKGMVLDSTDHDTWSAGSFFTNPVLSAADAEKLPNEAPRFTQPDGSVKTSAAWLINHAGMDKGFTCPSSKSPAAASLSSKHVLALTNRGGASSVDLVELAKEVKSRVAARFGIELVVEPVLVGVEI